MKTSKALSVLFPSCTPTIAAAVLTLAGCTEQSTRPPSAADAARAAEMTSGARIPGSAPTSTAARRVVAPGELPHLVPPVLLSGEPLRYPEAAMAACVGGKVIGRCVITEEGYLKECRIVSSSSPHFDHAVLDVLASRRYSPIYYKGHPQTVFYTFPFTFKNPCTQSSSDAEGVGRHGDRRR